MHYRKMTSHKTTTFSGFIRWTMKKNQIFPKISKVLIQGILKMPIFQSAPCLVSVFVNCHVRFSIISTTQRYWMWPECDVPKVKNFLCSPFVPLTYSIWEHMNFFTFGVSVNKLTPPNVTDWSIYHLFGELQWYVQSLIVGWQ